MSDLGLKQMLAVFLAISMLRPYPISAAPSAAVLGSISSYGTVTVGDLASPSENTLFAGDLVNTDVGSAVVQYKEGTRVLLAMNSTAQFTAGEVQLQAGQMTFRTASEQVPVFHASSLRLEAAPSSAANVILNDRKATVSVTEGTVRVVDPTGAPLASIQAGEARLFAMAASPAAASPAPPAVPAAPQMGGGNGTVWLLALGVATAATALAIAGLVRANNANDKADAAASQAASLQSAIDSLEGQIAAAQGQITTLQGQITTLQGQIAALQSSGSAQAAQIAALQGTVSTLQGQVTALQSLNASLQGQIAALESQVAALESSGSAQAAQIAALEAQNTALQGQIAGLQAQINTLLALIADLQQQLDNISP